MRAFVFTLFFAFSSVFHLIFSPVFATDYSQHILSLSPFYTWIETVRNKEKMSPEAILVAPMGSADAYLISSSGKKIKSWRFPSRLFDVKLDEEGNVLALYHDDKIALRQIAGAARLISSKGKVIWDYRNPNLHHTLSSTANKTSLLIAHKVVDVKKKISCDEIIELNRQGKEIWKLDIFPLLGNSYHAGQRPIGEFALDDSVDMCHTNSVREYPRTPFSAGPALLISLKNQDLMILVEKKSRKVLWRSPEGMSSQQHDARLAGEWIYFFNNGPASLPLNSEVARINMLTNKKEVIFEKKSFMSMPWGSVTKSGFIPMKNGNFLIVLGDPGQIWEITAEGELIRKIYLVSSRLQYELSSSLFNAEVYDNNFLKNAGII